MRYSFPIVLLSLAVSAREERACYKTSTGTFFTNHEFHDFRNYSDGLGPIPSLPDGLPKDLLPQQSDYAANPNIGQLQDGWLKSDNWTTEWNIQEWGKLATSDFPVRMQNSLSNVYLGIHTRAHTTPLRLPLRLTTRAVNNDTSNSTTKLVLRTHRFDEFQSSAEVE